MPRIKVLSTSSQQTCEESPQLFPHKVVSREGEIVRWKWVYVSDMRETFLGRCTTEEEENQSEMLGGRNFSNWKEFENRIEIRFFFFNINIAKSIRNQSILFKIWQVKGKSNRSTKLEAVCANEQRKRCFELSNERCLFSLPSPAISFPATIHGRGSFHSADTRESWASFEELICFVSFERALDAVACFRGSRNGGSRIESRQTRE